MEKKMTKEQKIKYIDNVQKHQIKRITNLQNETSELDCKMNEMHNMIIDMYKSIMHLENQVEILESDQFDLYVDRVVN